MFSLAIRGQRGPVTLRTAPVLRQHPDAQRLEHVAAWANERQLTELESMADDVLAYRLDDATFFAIVEDHWPAALESLSNDAWMVR